MTVASPLLASLRRAFPAWYAIRDHRPIQGVATIAVGRRIRELERLVKRYGAGHWRKRKGYAVVRLPNGSVRRAELHWYEAQGIGRMDMKIKRYLDP
jgi:hypothetical protein